MELSMGDIALLGRVKRPVVTVWRRRYADGPTSFPAPVRENPLRFDSSDVMAWLTKTGRGNNPDPAAEFAAIRLRESSPRDPQGVARLSAVLVLRHLYGDSLVADLTSPHRVLQIAASLDDAAAFVEDLPPLDEIEAVARVVESFVDHHLGVADAHSWLAENWFRPEWPALAQTWLEPPLLELVANAARAISDATGSPTILDVNGTAHSWLPLVPGEWEGDRVVEGSGPLARHTRRCVLLAGGDPLRSGAFRGSVVAVDLVLDETSVETQRRLGVGEPSQVRLIIGPARELTDPLPGAGTRDDVLRAGVVRAIVKLPPGLRATHPREHLALWLVAERDDQAFEEQRTFVADLSGQELTPSTISHLVSDLRAAALDPATHGRRNWRVLHAVRTRHLLARGTSLATGPPERSRSVRDPQRAVVELERITALTGFDGVVQIRPGQASGRIAVSVGEAIRRKWLRALPGVRLASDELPEGNVPVWSSAPTGTAVQRHVERFAALAVARTWLTQPGDIVFGGPGTGVLDADGGALVEYPARALRVAPGAPVTSEQVVRAINAGAPGTTAEHWEFGLIGTGARSGMSVVSERIRQRRTELLDELQKLQDFEETLLEACENQLVDLEVD